MSSLLDKQFIVVLLMQAQATCLLLFGHLSENAFLALVAGPAGIFLAAETVRAWRS